MSSVTRCPSCSTRFRVTAGQLEAGGGQVRCGICLAVFDARSALVEARPPAGQAASAEPEAAGAPAPLAPPSVPEFRLEPSRAEDAVASELLAPPPAYAAPRNGSAGGTQPDQLSFDDDLFAVETRVPNPAAKWWAAGGAVLALIFIVQAVYVYRGELGARYPLLKPSLVRLCEPIGCVVAPPQRPGQIRIEASDLEVSDPARPSVIRLTATLRNHAAYDLGYPALDLVLTDLRDHTLARRIFLPADYLERGQDRLTGLPAKGEVTIRVDIDTGELNPSGFRLDLLPAP